MATNNNIDGSIDNSIEIVDFTPELASAFRELNREWLERLFAIEPLDEAVLSRPKLEIIDPGGMILFALDRGSAVGTAALKRHGPAEYELTKMAVTERCRGRGIGRRLLDAAIARFTQAGGRTLFLESHSSLAPALRLYESAGFRHASPPRPSPYRRADVYMLWMPRAQSPSTPGGIEISS